jgi:hypothetical protein
MGSPEGIQDPRGNFCVQLGPKKWRLVFRTNIELLDQGDDFANSGEDHVREDQRQK